MNCRRFIQTMAAGALFMPGLGLGNTSPDRPNRPNVVIIYADDQSLGNVGCYGRSTLTPHIDSLTRDGLRFSRFYVNSAICCPSRYTLLSGRFASRSARLHKKYPPGGPVNLGWQPGIHGEPNTLPLLLQRAGYVTGCVGKWHQHGAKGLIKVDPGADPLAEETQAVLKANYAKHVRAVKECGFDYADGLYYRNLGDRSDPRRARWLPDPWRVHNQEWITAAALEFIEQSRDKPFFLYVSTTLTHVPSSRASLRKGNPRATPAGLLEQVFAVQPSREDVLRRGKRGRPGTIWLDDAVGAVLGKLEQLGMAENTVVIYASDNGDSPGKNTCYEIGAHMPLLIRWPAGIGKGGVRRELVSSIDIAPTLYALCGVTPPADAVVVDGRSFAPLVTGQGEYRRESLMLEVAATRAVVSDAGFKYIATRFAPDVQARVDAGEKFTHNGYRFGEHHHTGGAEKRYPGYFDKDQLYDLNNDRKEQRNLAGSPAHSAQLAALKAELKKYSLRLPHTFGEFTE